MNCCKNLILLSKNIIYFCINILCFLGNNLKTIPINICFNAKNNDKDEKHIIFSFEKQPL